MGAFTRWVSRVGWEFLYVGRNWRRFRWTRRVGGFMFAGITKPAPRRMRNWPFSRSFLPPLGCMTSGWTVARLVIAAATPPASGTFLEPGFCRFWQGTDVMLILPGCGAME